MRKTCQILIIAMLLTGISCTDDTSTDVGLPAPEQVKNSVGSQLIRLMQAQEGSFKRFQEVLEGKMPQYEYATLDISTDHGLYYTIPYIDTGGVVEGYVIYPLDEHLSLESKRADGILGVPRRIDAVVLTEEIPITKQYLYSVQFVRWKKQGLEVKEELMEPAILLSKPQIVKDGRVQARAFGHVESYGSGSWGDWLHVIAQMNYSQISNWTGGSVEVSTINLSKLRDMIEHYYYRFPSFANYANVSAIVDVGSVEIFVEFNERVSLETAEEFIQGVLRAIENEYEYKQYGLTFQYTAFFADSGTKSIGGGSSSGGETIITGGGGHGGSHGGVDGEEIEYPLTKNIIGNISALTESQKKILERAIEEAMSRNCYIEAIYNFLYSDGCKFNTAVIDPTIGGECATTVFRTKNGEIVKYVLKFRDEEYITCRGFSHELTHFLQAQFGVFTSEEARGMMEYERMLIDDIMFYAKYKGGEIPSEGWRDKMYSHVVEERYGDKEWNVKAEEYKEWLRSITCDGVPDAVSVEDFRKWASLFFQCNISYSSERGYKFDKNYDLTTLYAVLELAKDCD